uniref:L-fucose dehydrogenase-like n=1 Tax=Pogona vitticeps TaxID=103695 RepID=A0ABM5EI24_9SAUR
MGLKTHMLRLLPPKFGWQLRGAARTGGMAGQLRYPCKTSPGVAERLRYAGKVVCVTGGTRGIGEAIVRVFVHEGAKVVFCAQECERERGEALQRELEESGCPGEARFVVCDVAIEDDIKNLISVTINLYGCLDCLVNNAAIHPPYEETLNVTRENFSGVLRINAVGYLSAAKYALPHLRKTNGNIINISSIANIVAARDSIAYVTSKGGVTAMTKAMALDESKCGVRVNCISPGNIWTPMWQRLASESSDPEALIQRGCDESPLGRFGTPEEVARVALFLASEATFSTGADFLVTGGAELGMAPKFIQDAEGVKGRKQ